MATRVSTWFQHATRKVNMIDKGRDWPSPAMMTENPAESSMLPMQQIFSLSRLKLDDICEIGYIGNISKRYSLVVFQFFIL